MTGIQVNGFTEETFLPLNGPGKKKTKLSLESKK